MKKIKEIKKKNPVELAKMLEEKRTAVKMHRFKASGAKEKNVKESKEAKRDIARILTVLREDIKKNVA